MFLKHGNGAFSGIDAVVMQRDQLDVQLVGSDVLLNRLGALIILQVPCWLVIASTEYSQTLLRRRQRMRHRCGMALVAQ